jgi:putative copper export protein
MSGSNNFAADLALIPTILSSTHQGTLWYINSGALVVLLLGVLDTASRPKRVGTWAFFVALAIIAFTKAASGHAADDGDFTLMEWSQFLHIISTAVWAGCVLVAGFMVLPRLARHADAKPLLSFGNRLSNTVTWALAALLISGIYTSDRELHNTLSGLWTSTWGKILIAKVSFVLVAITLGASSRFLCLQRPTAHESSRATLMARLMLIEAVVMMCVLCLSGMLGNTAPTMSMT